MSWIQYEVWVETEDGGPDDLVHTTASLKEAKDMRSELGSAAYILFEDENGIIQEVE